MSSTAETSIDVPLAAAAASEALVPILQENGFQLDESSVPGAAELGCATKRTMFRSVLWCSAKITENGAGSTIALKLDRSPHERPAVLDGRRNRRTVKELEDQIGATLGSV